ncbi:MAG: YiiX/YebB-like N1pC/P60 family cysteine hydrolase [candidate division Zixibacteria bacterium]|nr:YiiX/YebB-like N1pC/P60 family cysteine hydrolase [candidate division Zixibacteria bacterium]MDH3938333.1 YiiX/YebB-like N1pC/P60 family cysteine hydrolase [candidate division Zixibacteria bacterium]MDH4035673.1 YiiX/YebB-like N1pC/P60 family cysteine hydrolase [candidate division Zixibacteria bacterium]
MNESLVHSYTINGLVLQTGDVICTSDGQEGSLAGQFWRLIGKLIPGEVDHSIVYVGPEGRCVEAGPKGVITFNIVGDRWDASAMDDQRGSLIDTLCGVVYPLENLDLSSDEESHIRTKVARYCLAQVGKEYNINFLNSETEDKFYCSQLAYKAYQPFGIDLNTEKEVPNLPGTRSIVFPQEIWAGLPHKRATQ